VDTPSGPIETALTRQGEQTLPSGATLTVRSDALGDEIQLRSANGAMELRIRMTDEGPVLSLRGVKLEIEATDSIAVSCREFAVNASDGVRLNTGGDFEVRSEQDIRMRSAADTSVDADYVKINCGDRTGYHDHDAEHATPSPPSDDQPITES
jgi:hypothetical protein